MDKTKKKNNKNKQEQKICFLTKKPRCFRKEINSSSFFEKDSLIKTQKGFVEKMCMHLKGECCENFLEHPKWTRMNA